MSEPSPRQVFDAIGDLTVSLVRDGLADDQERPRVVGDWTDAAITTMKAVDASVLKNVSYEDLYADQLRRRAFNVRLLDGALLQMSYDFVGGNLQRHRLAFLPSPTLLDFQTNPDLYMEEVLFADVVGWQAVTVPLRIDFDARPNVPTGPRHPAAHLTLGQYRHCRIPVTAPVTPGVFVDFVIRHFYRTPEMPEPTYDRSLDRAFALSNPVVESDAVHFVSPGHR